LNLFETVSIRGFRNFNHPIKDILDVQILMTFVNGQKIIEKK